MLFFDGALSLFMFGLWIYCIIDVITSPAGAVRNLPKLLWLVIVILLPDVGSIIWLIAGHTWGPRDQVAARGNGRGASPAPRRPARASNPDDDDDFLAGLKARTEEQRRRAREQQGEPPAE